MSRTILAFAVASAFQFFALHAADSPRFRGADGDGVFPETGLLQEWPEGGPELLWSAEGLGESYASVTVADDRIYTTGMTAERGTVYALDTKGELLWKTEYGAEFNGRGYPGSRTTPTLHDGSLYLISSLGTAVALDAEGGAIRWKVDLFGKYDGKNSYFGHAESPLVVDDKVIFTAGGPDAALVALDPESGETVWTTKGLSDGTAYCSPRLFDNGKHRQIVTLVAKHLVGIDPGTGEVVWRQPLEVRYDIHAVSPEFVGNTIYVSHGYDQGGRAFELAEDGRSVTAKWTEPDLDIHHGGAVVVDGRIYGAASNGTWMALDAESGAVLASIRRLGKGSMAYADGRLYGYTEAGKVVLVDPDPESFRKVSSFEVEAGSGNHWSHPVIVDGVLYVRHGEALMAYRIATPGPAVGAAG